MESIFKSAEMIPIVAFREAGYFHKRTVIRQHHGIRTAIHVDYQPVNGNNVPGNDGNYHVIYFEYKYVFNQQTDVCHRYHGKRPVQLQVRDKTDITYYHYNKHGL